MQLLNISVCLPSDSQLRIVGIYRAPDFPLDSLLTHLTDVMPQQGTSCMIVGDFNINLLKTADLSVTRLQNFFLSHNFHQCLHTHTSDYGSLIDHCWTNIARTQVQITVLESYFSDHSPIACQLAAL